MRRKRAAIHYHYYLQIVSNIYTILWKYTKANVAILLILTSIYVLNKPQIKLRIYHISYYVLSGVHKIEQSYDYTSEKLAQLFMRYYNNDNTADNGGTDAQNNAAAIFTENASSGCQHTESLQKENSYLKKVVNYVKNDTEYFTIVTNITFIPDDIFETRAVIMAGRKDGVSRGNVVTFNNKLLGRVVELYDEYSIILLLNQEQFRIPAFIPRTNHIFIAKGRGGSNNRGGMMLSYVTTTKDTGGNTIIYEDINNSSSGGGSGGNSDLLQNGDLITTFEELGVVPGGIEIGLIQTEERDDNKKSRSAESRSTNTNLKPNSKQQNSYIMPSVNFQNFIPMVEVHCYNKEQEKTAD